MSRLRRIGLAIKSEDYRRRTPPPDSIRAYSEEAEVDSASAARDAGVIGVAGEGELERDASNGESGSAQF